ncbi:MAG: hypothetical protein V7K47_06310 [Nostoc sp.]
MARHGGYRHGVEQYYWQINRWAQCGHLLCTVAQDWMCEPFALARTGLSVDDHQRLTIERYDRLIKLKPIVEIMPVLQGYRISDYLKHLNDYNTRLIPGLWVGVGSVCRRNGNPQEVADILRSIKLIRPDLRLHWFGLKMLALQNPEVRSFLHSADSMAWSYPRRFQPDPKPDIPMAHDYQQRIHAAVNDNVQKRRPPPRTAGAGNGQGRKSKWKSPTQSVRIPKKYIHRVVELCQEWEEQFITFLGTGEEKRF